MTTITKIDHAEVAAARTIQQYKNQPKFTSLVALLAGMVQEMEDAWFSMLNLPDIDLMEGENLDNIGRIVGQERELVDANDIPFFGYEGDPGSYSYGDLNDDSVGARFRSLYEDTTSSVLLTDPEYRVFIRARIAKNNTNATPEDFIKQVQLIFGVDDVTFTEGLMSIQVGIGKILDPFEIYLVENYDLLPKPAGVRIDYVYNYAGENVYAFEGTSGRGYGDLNDGSVGGFYASLLGGGTPVGREYSGAYSGAFA